MGIDLSLTAKSNIDLSLEEKDASLTWDEANWTWDEAGGTWEVPGRALTKESKSNISLALESK